MDMHKISRRLLHSTVTPRILGRNSAQLKTVVMIDRYNSLLSVFAKVEILCNLKFSNCRHKEENVDKNEKFGTLLRNENVISITVFAYKIIFVRSILTEFKVFDYQGGDMKRSRFAQNAYCIRILVRQS